MSLAELRRLFRDMGAAPGREAVLREAGARFARARDGVQIRTAFGVENGVECGVESARDAGLALDMSGFVLGLLAGAPAFGCESPCAFLQQKVIPHAKAAMRALGERCAGDARFMKAVFPEEEQRAQAEKTLGRLAEADFEDAVENGGNQGGSGESGKTRSAQSAQSA